MSSYPPQQGQGGGVPPYQQPPAYQPPPYGQPPMGGMPGYGAPGYEAMAITAYAGFWRRFAAYLIDVIILGVVSGILSSIFGLGSGTAEGGAANFNFNGGGTLLSAIIFIVYFTLMIGLIGKTVGGMVLGIKVTTVDGSPVGIGKAAIRSLIACVLGFTVILGLISNLWMIWDGKKQTWHDKAAGTVVVRS